MPKRKSLMEPDQILVMQGETSTPELRGFLRQQGVFIPPVLARSGALAFLGERLLSRQKPPVTSPEAGAYVAQEAAYSSDYTAPAPRFEPAPAPSYPPPESGYESGFGRGSESESFVCIG